MSRLRKEEQWFTQEGRHVVSVIHYLKSRYMQEVLYDVQMQPSLLIMVAIDETKNLRSHKRNLIMYLEESAPWAERSAAECETLDGELYVTEVTGP